MAAARCDRAVVSNRHTVVVAVGAEARSRSPLKYFNNY